MVDASVDVPVIEYFTPTPQDEYTSINDAKAQKEINRKSIAWSGKITLRARIVLFFDRGFAPKFPNRVPHISACCYFFEVRG